MLIVSSMDEFEERVSGGDQEVREKDWTEPPEEPGGLQEEGEYNPFRETGQILLCFWYNTIRSRRTISATIS